MPGLIDAHVHPGWHLDRQGKRNSERSGATPGQGSTGACRHLYATPAAGFTTTKASALEDLELAREATARGLIPGPRILIVHHTTELHRAPRRTRCVHKWALKARRAQT
jgi:imidazolonepropionase-like amidohydrolase